MSTKVIAALVMAALVGFVVLIGGGLVIGYVSFSNDANGLEVDITSQYTQMKNVYDNGWKEVMETAQVPESYRDDMIKVWQTALSGRYGANGSQATMQFIKEANPNMNSKLYERVQDKIESFHATFSASQTKLISEKQTYNRMLNATTSGRLYNFVGKYPHIHIGIPSGSTDDYAILTSDKTETDFTKHRADVLQIHKDK